jgi:hypothetical protein
MTVGDDVAILADHPIWIAVPAFLPAFIVAGVVIYIAVRNRRNRDGSHSQTTAPTDQDETP